MNALDTIKTAIKAVKDVRKDPELAGGMVSLLNIAKEAAVKTAEENKADAKLQKGFVALNEALSIVVGCVEKGISLTSAFTIPTKLIGLKPYLEPIGGILEQEDHPVTKAFSAHITTAKGFDQALNTVWKKADGNMLNFTAVGGGGLDVTELVSGQNIRLCRLSADECKRAERILASGNCSNIKIPKVA